MNFRKSIISDMVMQSRKFHPLCYQVDVDVTENTHDITARMLRAIVALLSRQPHSDLHSAWVRGGKKWIDEITATVTLNVEVNGRVDPYPCVLKNVGKMSVDDIRNAMNEFKKNPVVRSFHSLPGILRRAFWWIHEKSAWVKKKTTGIIGLSNLGPEATGVAFTQTHFTFFFIISGIKDVLIIKDGFLRMRKVLPVVVVADHRVVDGVPLVRLMNDIEKFINGECNI
ncbi:MAG: 2-oxo acid dehydrogenase subunit E2 [Promethearchaeota archaeon]|nr:MAG: CoA-dependent acyltransferase [Helarchaeota virus Nidhogg Meg22_1012]URC17350.1 MAG: CoA-dependent acyltransferase [Helarchaeota virus Nidhogg Meg22_1214]